MKKRLVNVDIARCICLCFIITAHTQWYMWVSAFDDMRLAIFWFCAGYTSRPDVNLLGKTRLLVNYAVLSAVCILFAVAYSGMAFEWSGLWGALYARYSMWNAPVSADNPVLLPYYNQVLWFLPALFTSYCLFKVIMKARGFRLQLLLCLCSLAIGSLLYFQPYLLPWSADVAFTGAVFMCIGRWLRTYGLVSRAPLAVALAAVIAYAVLSQFVGFINLSVSNYGGFWPLLVPTAALGVIALLILCRYIEKTWIGRLAVIFNSQALFIFGLQMVFIKLTDDWFGVYLTDWKLHVLAYVCFCFLGGFIIGKIYDLCLKGCRNLIVRTLTKSGI